MTQPTALYLADVLEHAGIPVRVSEKAAAELRRLSEIETLYLAAMRGRHAMSEELLAVTAQRDALLEALKYHQEQTRPIQRTIDAIKAAEGEQR